MQDTIRKSEQLINLLKEIRNTPGIQYYEYSLFSQMFKKVQEFQAKLILEYEHQPIKEQPNS